MLTLLATDGSGFRCLGGGKNLAVFTKGQGEDLELKPVPEEVPSPNSISWPGEYDVGGVAIRGLGQSEGQQVSFLAVVDDKRCAFLSSPLATWSDEEVEHLGSIDVLVMPAEDSKLAQTIVESIDPRVLVLIPGKGGQVDPDVLKVCGATGKEFVAEHKLKGLPAEGREVVILAK